eukprot:TRINITY_DN8295_c0_g1_i2.p1 TRINITY_DN8295_c0_g1~~TRINITY_DN8295_c0_g1_i2.p1  ORF type:complete len:751 (+),score=211.07 TRINITY_DN8295_c0_g1_i2:93-2255(+)
MAAVDIENMTKAAIAQDISVVGNIINQLVTSFVASSQSNSRKGGLIGLAAVAIGLGPDYINEYLQSLVDPVVRTFSDQDSKVRYYACESLYNISKVARGSILRFFNPIFDGLCKACADADSNVKNGAQLLDRLIKDIVAESETFDVKGFIPLLAERIYVINPFVRQFLVGWITVLDSVPDIDMVDYLPDFLDGLFGMLSDANKDIRRRADLTLTEFLGEIKQAKSVDFPKMVGILVKNLVTKGMDEFTRLTALSWVSEFILIGKETLLPYTAQLLECVLPALSNDNEEIKREAWRANNLLMELVRDTAVLTDGDVQAIIEQCTTRLVDVQIPTRLASLRWILMLHHKTPERVHTLMSALFPALLKTVSDVSEEVVRLALEVLARISQEDKYFSEFMTSLVQLFSTDKKLLKARGSLVIRQISLFLNPERVFRALSRIIETDLDLAFASLMVQTLNLILLTAPEFYELRTALHDLSLPDSRNLFVCLYRCWSHNAVATLSLCLLAQAYKHASELVLTFAQLEVTVGFLIELDKLVQLLESPIFTRLRLQLLEPEEHPFLYKTLFGLLMLLPQATAFATLKSRLNSVSTLTMLYMLPNSGLAGKTRLGSDKANAFGSEIAWDDLHRHFLDLQERQASSRRQNLRDKSMDQPSAAFVSQESGAAAVSLVPVPTLAASGSAASAPASAIRAAALATSGPAPAGASGSFTAMSSGRVEFPPAGDA